jgi:hypothetical protein
MHCAVKPEFSPTYIDLNLAVKGKKTRTNKPRRSIKTKHHVLHEPPYKPVQKPMSQVL